ncbi:hypothetical protein UA32_11680 [Photobacterium angustum]|uniref:TraD/TraG TraM recognition site domain-containing protein n=1 Tax=Photobacterium angustum TaxID=661 RepID=A0ABX5H1W4_PHOAN|nr:conjugative transfer system coupling protein TraD [Photobacterium angustum]KJG37623.1 hypothetical protein UA32_11680 [Photobacterium angustum]PSX07077.1 hypothetical protein C0W27_16030 [Photobacterium angustum]
MRDINDTRDLFRPEYELNIGTGYLAAGIASTAIGGVTLTTVGTAPFVVSAVTLGLSLHWYRKAIERLRLKSKLINNYFYFKPIPELRTNNLEHPDKIYIGKGFKWGAEHATLYHRLASMSTDLREVNLPTIFRKAGEKNTRLLGGKAYIHGLGEEEDTYVDVNTLYGHSVLFGNPGTGKTTLLNMLSTGTLNRNSFNFIVDPKPDEDWKARMEEECRVMGVPFYYFSTSNASESVCIDVLKDYEDLTDIPTRILDTTSTGAQDDNDSFRQFTWKCINQIVQAMEYCSIEIQITSISYYLRHHYTSLAEQSLKRFYTEFFGSEERFNNMKRKMKSKDNPDEKAGGLFGMIDYYNDDDSVPTHKRVTAVDNIIGYVQHPKEHRDKMLASTDPLFDQLTAPPLDKLLSPRLDDVMGDSTKGSILNFSEMLESGGCLYLAFNSMGNSKMAGNLSKLLISALSSVASKRYTRDGGVGRRVALFVDEAHAAINEKLINMLAVGRAGAFEVYLSTQTIPDLIAKTDEATANRVLGLASNLFALRVTDPITKEYVSSNFGMVDVDQYSYARGDRAGGSSELFGDAATTYTETIGREQRESFPGTAQSEMPNLQCMARLANGNKYKLRIPILTKDKPKKSLFSIVRG